MSDADKSGPPGRGAAKGDPSHDWLDIDDAHARIDRAYAEGLKQVQQLQVQRLHLQAKSLTSARWLQIALIVLTVFGGLSLGIAWLLYGSTFSGPRTYDAGAWGQAGDFIGGVTNPVLTFLSLIALVLTVKLQNDQLGIARDDLEIARQATKESQQREVDQLKAAAALVDLQQRTVQAQERAARVAAYAAELDALQSALNALPGFQQRNATDTARHAALEARRAQLIQLIVDEQHRKPGGPA